MIRLLAAVAAIVAVVWVLSLVATPEPAPVEGADLTPALEWPAFAPLAGVTSQDEEGGAHAEEREAKEKGGEKKEKKRGKGRRG